MRPDERVAANFIIGGTEKAGTTSVFCYLSEHPQVCGSQVKETNFFRFEYSGDRERDLSVYARHFPRARSASVIMEASPAYLGCAHEVAPRIAALAPDARLLFILRDPIERLYSSYHFHVGRLDISEAISFEDYVERCLSYDCGEARAEQLGLDRWYLDVLRFGRYAEFLAPFYATLPDSNIKIMFFERLRSDAPAFMKELSDFLHIDAAFWEHYEFKTVNKTFAGRNKLLHRAAVAINEKAEPHLRQRPRLKRALVGLYKSINQGRDGYAPMPAAVRGRLAHYYGPSTSALTDFLGDVVPPEWQTAESHA